MDRLRFNPKDLAKVETKVQFLRDDERFLAETTSLREWLLSIIRFHVWHLKVEISTEWDWESLLNPPQCNPDPTRKHQLKQYQKYGLLFQCYDLVRMTTPPLPLPSGIGDREKTVLNVLLWRAKLVGINLAVTKPTPKKTFQSPFVRKPLPAPAIVGAEA